MSTHHVGAPGWAGTPPDPGSLPPMLPRRLSRAGIATGLVLLLVAIAATVLSYLDVKNNPT